MAKGHATCILQDGIFSVYLKDQHEKMHILEIVCQISIAKQVSLIQMCLM
jgi:hypothetical protein